MEYRGVDYQVLQTIEPRWWRWIVHLEDGGEKTGVAISKSGAVFRAIKTIDRVKDTNPSASPLPIENDCEA
jgi:hypothetical protein